ncbi:hypothetical protein, variant [Aphanomyces invadans]|uniref:Uncharacterized protein n=1 Tax=Aphanomyces invadans TaxID=157072 RepID=A0A024UIC4_9STRA|nr:hypothetical protein, variant [Aphanomyces invadans]ETW05627.1 hypothetical protein, variant [Aphanomyces invadans]|eukprot:XP_008865404.1 hypothetical protein, variant [Aphanomyces invadans]
MSPQTKPTSTAPLPSVDPAAAQKALDKKMKQRLYIRKMMRIYRDEHRQCREYLIKRIDELSVQLAELVRRSSVRKESSTMLSWRDVSHAIHEDLQACAGDNQGLESQVGAYRNLLGNMQRWVASCERVTESLSPAQPSWRLATLLADPQARRLGKAWITQHMYHNSGKMFQNFPPASPWEDVSAIDVSFEGDLMYLTLQRQFVLPGPLHDVLEMYRHHLIDVMMPEHFENRDVQSLTETTDTTVLHQAITPHTNEFMSFLGGEFHDGPDKVMFVIQQIVDDETQTKHHHHHRQRNRKFWVEMRPQPVGGGTYIRYIAICTQSLAQGRYFTLEEEASVFGLDLSTCPDVDKESRLTTHMTRIIWQKRWNCQKRAGDLLSQSIVAT